MKISFPIKSKKILIPLVLLSLASLVYLYVATRKSSPLPNQNPTTPSISSNQESLSKLTTPHISIDPNASLPSLPPTLPVYSAQSGAQINYLDLLNQISSRFNAKQTEFSPHYYASSDNSLSIHFDPYSDSISYTIDSNLRPEAYSGSSDPDTQSAIASAQAFVQQVPQFSSLEIQPNLVSYYEIHPGENEYDTALSPDTANLIEIPFTQTFNSYPYRSQSQVTPPLIVTVAQKNQVVKFIYTPQPLPTTTASSPHYTLTLSEITEALLAGQGQVVYAPLYNIPPQITELPPVIITDIKIEYRFDPQSSSLSPYFSLTGHFLTPNSTIDIKQTVILLLPAVKYS